jgi:hypothetical protein
MPRPVASLGTMGLHSLERHLERMVDGVFRRAFRTRVRPLELGRRLIREMDDGVTTTNNDRGIAPNRFVVRLHPDDLDELAPLRDALLSELAEAARDYAHSEGWSLPGPVEVDISPDATLRPGRFEIVASLHTPTAVTHAGALVLASGEQIVLEGQVVGIGRLPSCEVVVADPNASRRHAEVRPQGGGYVVVDLGSTNGTRVNGLLVVGDRLLADGDVIGVGTTTVRFEAG